MKVPMPMSMSNSSAHRSFLFVCTGNICRSPTAEGLMDYQLKQMGIRKHFILDSAGVDSHHIGQPPDPRTQSEAKIQGVDLSNLRARNVRASDFTEFDVILAMDNSHFEALQKMKPQNATALITLYLDYAGIAHTSQVPDPYYGQTEHFKQVFALINEATSAIIPRLQATTP